jgi:HK97 family phage major capsid protein
MATAKKISSLQVRSMNIERGVVDEEKRTLDLSFSSEFPVERWFGVEILDHSEGSVDLSRMNGSAALLLNHDPDRQIGVIEKAWLKDRKMYATVRFSSGALGEEIFRDVKDGIRNLVSIGYRLTDRKKVTIEEIDGKETYRFQEWQPYEGSIVSVPADPTVGVGRNQETEKQDFELPIMKRNLLLDADPPEKPGTGTDTAESRDQILRLERMRKKELREIAEQFKGRVENIEELRNQAEDGDVSPDAFARSLAKKMSNAPIPNGDTPPKRSSIEITDEERSLGEQLVRANDYKSFTKGDSQKFQMESRGNLPQLLQRATLLSTGLTSIQKVPGVVLVDQQPLRVADIFASGTTNSTTIRFTKESSFTNAATAVAEEGQKPEATFALEEADVTVKKIAVVGRVSDEMFADYEYAQSYVNSRLLFMVAAKEDYDLLNGAAGNAITGVLNVSGIQTQAFTANLADSIHKAVTKIMSTPGFVGAPEHLVIHPTDWQNLVLTKDSNGQYYAGGPFMGQYGQGGVARSGPWGLTPVITTSIAQGTALVAAGRIGATVLRKGGIMIDTTNSDASDFVYNRIAIRAEERLCLVPYRPKAFCKITGIPLA